VPAGIVHLPYRDVMDFDALAWRREYQRCWPAWRRTIKDACARYAFPEGAFELLALELMVASQRVLGCLRFLEAHRPSVILTEYDRNALWSCLVLAARKLGIPSLTLVHASSSVMHSASRRSLPTTSSVGENSTVRSSSMRAKRLQSTGGGCRD